MSKPRISISAVIDTTAHALQILSAISSEISGRDIFKNHGISLGQTDDGRILITAELMFNRTSHRDALKDLIIARVRDNPVIRTWILTGTQVTRHTCTHDEPEDQIRPCTETAYLVEFEK